MLAVLLLNRMSSRHLDSRAYRKERKMKKEKKSTNDILEMCRTCLSTVDLMSIFYNKETERRRTEDLRILTGLEIKMDDGLPQKICAQCIEIMNISLQFRIKSINAQKKLLSMLPIKKSPMIVRSTPAEDVAEGIGFDYGLYHNEMHNDHNYVKVNKQGLIEKFLKKSKQMYPTVISENGRYKCNMCEKEYKSKYTLRAHIHSHTNYCVCEVCGRKFLNEHLLVAHKRARHGLERVHLCTYCDYSSATREALVVHERRHTGEKPYMCDHCGLAFHRRSNLIQHLPIHLPESNFQCSICHKREKSKRLLQHHHFKVHRQKRYRYLCPVCQDVFRSPGTVRQHLTRSHGVARHEQGVIDKILVKPQISEENLPPNINETYLLHL
ncbi:zinc finger protein 180-like isoform X2 [Achroia grisella]|uniref:zinc finger protein 180-like isoform X2 n=1 Tax=Achroia grisella TaxID=688607 RepID=UPI0027D30E82|nr:zinc finger protein 180-like isoform X2 [Achroia grisella]